MLQVYSGIVLQLWQRKDVLPGLTPTNDMGCFSHHFELVKLLLQLLTVAGPIEIWDWVINATDKIISLQKVLNFYTLKSFAVIPKNRNVGDFSSVFGFFSRTSIPISLLVWLLKKFGFRHQLTNPALILRFPKDCKHERNLKLPKLNIFN